MITISKSKQRISCYVNQNKNKRQSTGVQKDPVSSPDLQKLYTSFNLQEAERPKNKVFVDYMLFLWQGEE